MGGSHRCGRPGDLEPFNAVAGHNALDSTGPVEHPAHQRRARVQQRRVPIRVIAGRRDSGDGPQIHPVTPVVGKLVQQCRLVSEKSGRQHLHGTQRRAAERRPVIGERHPDAFEVAPHGAIERVERRQGHAVWHKRQRLIPVREVSIERLGRRLQRVSVAVDTRVVESWQDQIHGVAGVLRGSRSSLQWRD